VDRGPAVLAVVLRTIRQGQCCRLSTEYNAKDGPGPIHGFHQIKKFMRHDQTFTVGRVSIQHF
jgi:hypothetical protein